MFQTENHYDRPSGKRRLAISQWAATCVLGVFCLGCWQEVHYVPSEKAPSPDSPTTSKTVELPNVEPPPREPEPIAEPTAADTDLPDEQPPVVSTVPGRTALAAWKMASEWSMAAALQAKGRDAEGYGEQFDQANDAAELLGVDLPALPTHADDGDRLATNVDFLLEESGPELASELRNAHGTNHAALAELAIKTHVLLLTYTPTSTQIDPVVAAIRRAAENSGLPEVAWSELAELLQSRADFQDVKAAVFQLHEAATAYLGGDGT